MKAGGVGVEGTERVGGGATIGEASTKLLGLIGGELFKTKARELLVPFEMDPARSDKYMNLSAGDFSVSAAGADGLALRGQVYVGNLWHHGDWKPIPGGIVELTHRYASFAELAGQIAAALREQAHSNKTDADGVTHVIGSVLALSVKDDLVGRFKDKTGATPKQGQSIGITELHAKSIGTNELQIDVSIGVIDHRGLFSQALDGSAAVTYRMNAKLDNLVDAVELARFVEVGRLIEGGLTSSATEDIIPLVRSIASRATIVERPSALEVASNEALDPPKSKYAQPGAGSTTQAKEKTGGPTIMSVLADRTKAK